MKGGHMKTVKEVSEIFKVSIRTLRYYDEIGLLKPTKLTKAGYRLYDNNEMEKLQQIMFFRELEIPLADIKQVTENSNFNKEQLLSTQKSLLEKQRNRLNGLIQLITDVMKGANTMSFEAFNNDDVQKIIDHMLESMSKEAYEEKIKEYGSIEKYRKHLSTGFQNEQAVVDLMKWYGGKERVMSSIEKKELTQLQSENDEVYRQLIQAREIGNMDLEKEAVEKLAEGYKAIFKIDNARAMLLDLAKEYLKSEKLTVVTDNQYGKGCSEYIAQAIKRYYGE
jgi:DNA-binding transcriptional MerR regulator